MTYGNIVFFGGIALMSVAILLLIIGTIAFSTRRNSLKKKLIDKYGF